MFFTLAVALLIMVVVQASDLHTSVVLLKAHSPEAKLSRTTEVVYSIVDRIKR